MYLRRTVTILSIAGAALGVLVAVGGTAATAADPVPPVRDVRAAAVTTTSATLRWVNPKVSTFTGVSIRRHAGAWSSEGSVFRVATSGPVDQWTDTGLTPGGTYSYGLYANHGSSGFASVEVVTVRVPTAPDVTGTVTAEDGGAALGNVVVTAFDTAGRVGGRGVSAADGTYAIFGLTAGGSYRVCFAPDALNRSLTTGFGYLELCYGEEPFLGSPQVRINAPASKVDNALPTGGAISGNVYTEGPNFTKGPPVAGATVVLGDYESDPIRYTTTDQSGNYHFAGAGDGSRTVCVDTVRATSDVGGGCWAGRGLQDTPNKISSRRGEDQKGIDFRLTGPLTGVGSDGTNTRRLNAEPCAGALFLAARGSGESGAGGIRNIQGESNQNVGGPVFGVYDRMRTKLSGVGLSVTGAVNVFYRADNTFPDIGNNDYVRNVWAGVREARRALTERAAQCPNEAVVLAGFGQGAALMRRLLTNATTTGVTALDPAILARVQAGVLLGNADRVADDPVTRFGDADPRSQGIATQLDPSVSGRAVSTAVGAGIFDVCAAGDVLCDSHMPYGCTAATLATCAANRAAYAIGERINLTAYNGTAPALAAADAAVARVLRAPHIKPQGALPDAKVGSAYTYDLKTIDNRPGTWTVGSGLPHGLSLTGKTISGTPDTVDYATFTVTFTDAQGRRTSARLTISVQPETIGIGRATQLPGTATAQHIWAAANGDALVSYATNSNGDRYVQWRTPTGPRGPAIELPAKLSTRVVIDEQNTAYFGIAAASSSTGGSFVKFADGDPVAYDYKDFVEPAGSTTVYRVPTDIVYSGTYLYLTADVPDSCSSPRLYRFSRKGAILARTVPKCASELGFGGGNLIARSGTRVDFLDPMTLATKKSYTTDDGQFDSWSAGPTGDVVIATRGAAGTRLFRVTAATGVVWQSSLNDVLGETDSTRTHYVRSLNVTSDNAVAVTANTVNSDADIRAFVSPDGTVTGRTTDTYSYATGDLPDGDGHVLVTHSNYCYGTVPCEGARTDRYDAGGGERVYTGPTPPSSYADARDQAVSPGRLHLLVNAEDDLGRSDTRVVVVDVAGLRPAAWPVP